ncbi:MAG: hypothetical protein AAGF71_04390 [Pseudomonadota bacterium]
MSSVSAAVSIAPTHNVNANAQTAEPKVNAPAVSEPRDVQVTINNPVLESVYTAHLTYDVRGVSEDLTPRGVEIDRIKMIEQGFEHIRNMINPQGNAQSGGESKAASLDITV